MFRFLTSFFIVTFLIQAHSHAGMVSNMPATYKETGIPNSHLVSENLIRGMAPRNDADLDRLINLGVKEFLVFKIDTNGDVQKEIDSLISKGIPKKNISQYDFPWKDISDFRSVCEMTIDALKKMEAAEKNKRKMYFHCTVGEDRTGYLAGLYRIYAEKKSVDEVFVSELCDRGYEAGNPKKGMNVVVKIRESLTPSFLTMAKIIQEASKNGSGLSKKLCGDHFEAENWKDYKCKTSKLFR